MSFVIKAVGERRGVIMCINGYISTVNCRMYCIFGKDLFNKVEVKFRLEDICKRDACEHTIVFGVKKGIGFVPLEYKGVYQLTREFVYLCTICGGDKRRVVCFMLAKHSVHIVNLDNFLHLVRRYNIRTDDRFKKTIDVTQPPMWL